MRCYNCGSELPEGSKYCLSCGRKVGEKSQPSSSNAEGSAEHLDPSKKKEGKRFKLPLFHRCMIFLVLLLLAVLALTHAK
ncbi:MAG: hypothetical protein IKZ67_03340 [Paludibacteraceae bacterium]|nr:hypothetical protein [Paludibacteraceae bacterium]